jgi:RimJ/RimL family protein N-acetyltransferase
MDTERFDPATDAAAVRACHEIYLASAAADGQRRPPMSSRVFRTWLVLGWDDHPSESWLARDEAGRIRGFYVLSRPARENRHIAQVSPVVHPSWRRAGLGTALAAHAVTRAREAGRTLVTGPADEGSAGEAFARALGARYLETGRYSALRLDPVPGGHLAALRQQAAAASAGYSLLTWDGLVPGERLDEVAKIYAAEADAPRPPGVEPARWDAERVRADDQRIADQGLRFYAVAARAERDGKLVAITQLGVDPARPDWGVQELTAVVRPHRGHRLGLLVKLAMLDLLGEREPQVTRILTHNAEGNEHMIAINTALGFELLERQLTWEIEAARAPVLAGRAAAGRHA